ncbi:MAG: lipoprotein signal peptidase [Saprospiraceae bacterium]|nr:lipoprotein signal peptidase [Saprospiraceae bacterium]
MKRSRFVILVVLLVLMIDQALKIWIKTNLTYGEEFGILGLSWARIHFVENEGMAFGISFGGEFGKLALSLFRLIAVGFLIYIIRALVQARESRGLLASFALILAGAIGNIIDSAAYGLIFTESTYHSVAEMFPEGGGYASFLHGRVVDMLYFPLIDTTLPDWFPVWGGDRFEFFKPVFNIADSAISVGVISMLVFHRRFLRTGQTTTAVAASPEISGASEEE